MAEHTETSTLGGTDHQHSTWRRPEILLLLMAAAMPISFSVWTALLNNFSIEQAAFTGAEIGILQSLREVPGFLSFAVVFLLLFVREQPLALLSLALLGIGTALTGYFPSVLGLYVTTVIMSIGFHYYEAVQQSLTLQWVDKKNTPVVMGRMISANAIASIAAFGLVYGALSWINLDYHWIYLAAGAATAGIAVFCWLAFPRFAQPAEQHKKIILRPRYWLYYALVFMSGARRQIFIVFAGFLMVEKFGYDAEQIALLFLLNMVVNVFAAPRIGRMIAWIGERRALVIEYIGLIGVFTAYAFVDSALWAAVLYVVDHLFFAMAIAIKTYFQKIADPKDIASTASVSFTINHIAAVVIPAAFGMIWLLSPAAVFLIGAAMAGVSLLLALFIPPNPTPGFETTLKSETSTRRLAGQANA
ncbi:MAG: MFS transporter [Pseudomonadota bacterium]